MSDRERHFPMILHPWMIMKVLPGIMSAGLVIMAAASLAAELNPQSPLAPQFKTYKEELAGQRVILPNLAFVMPRQERPGNAWDDYRKAALAVQQAMAENPALASQPPAILLRDPRIRQATLEFYNATRTQKFDTSALAASSVSFLATEDDLNKTLTTLDALATLTRQIGREQMAARKFENAADNAQTQIAMGWHWMSMPLNARMIQDGFRYIEEGLKTLLEINKATLRPDLEQKIDAALKQLAHQREVWEWKGELLRKFLPSDNPELLLIIRDDMLADADPAFHLYALEYLNEIMRLTLNMTGDPAFNLTLDYNQRKSLRLLFAAERTMIRRLGEKFESSQVPGIAFQARQMKELAARMN